MKFYNCFSVLLLLLGAGSCKNEKASKQIDLLLKKKEQKYTSSNSGETDQKDDVIASASNSKRANNHTLQMAGNHPHENSKGHLEQTHQVDAKPSFILKDITIQAGTQQSTMLEITGNTKKYIIKSISVSQNRPCRTDKFDLNKLKKTEIPPAGLPITLTPHPTLKAGAYELNITIEKKGKGSRKTEKSAKCMIYVIENELKKEKQHTSFNTNRTIQALNSEAIDQHDGPIQAARDSVETIEEHLAQNHTTPEEPSFTLKDITIQAGTQQSTMLEVTGNTKKYIIKSISVSQNRPCRTDKFDLNKLKKTEIPPAGLPITLTPHPTLKAGAYELSITIGKEGKGSRKTEKSAKCMIYVIEDEVKK